MKHKFAFVAIMLLVTSLIISFNNDIINKTIKSVLPDQIKIVLKKIVLRVTDIYKNHELRLETIQSKAKSEYLKKNKSLKEIKVVKSKFNSYNIKNFPLPFPSYDDLNSKTLPSQWRSKPVAYFEQTEDEIFISSGIGNFFIFSKKNIETNNLELNEIKSNIDKLYKLRASSHSIRDLLILDNYIYLSITREIKKNIFSYCYNTLILRAPLNSNYLKFSEFFSYPECQYKLNQSSGGRMFPFKKNNILFSVGEFLNERYKNKTLSQNKNSIFGKIISVNKKTKNFDIISMGSRNPQGLYYDNTKDVIIHTEHGPRGGDEININLNPDNVIIENYGWPISSYGEHYDGKYRKHAPLNKSHVDFGFIEPIKYFTPSIGISELIKIPQSFNKKFTNDFFVSALGWKLQMHEGDLSIHHIRFNDTFTEIVFEDVIPIGERIRDMLYIKNNNAVLLLLESVPSLGLLKLDGAP